MIGITFTLKDGHMVEVCEGNSTCCPWGLDYARELGVPLSAKVGIDTWALIDDEEVYTINHMWHQKTCSDMRLDEWLEENADTYAGKLSKIKADIDRVKEEEEFVKTMTKNEKAAFFAGKRGARLEDMDMRKKAENFDTLVNYLKAKLKDCHAMVTHTAAEKIAKQTQNNFIVDLLELVRNLEKQDY